jgi:hypothetical protein
MDFLDHKLSLYDLVFSEDISIVNQVKEEAKKTKLTKTRRKT